MSSIYAAADVAVCPAPTTLAATALRQADPSLPPQIFTSIARGGRIDLRTTITGHFAERIPFPMRSVRPGIFVSGITVTYSSKFNQATGGYREVPDDWISGSSLRPLYLGCACHVWLRHHGAKHGFQKDPEDYSFLGFQGDLGGRFETKWCEENAPGSVQGVNEDWEVRHSKALKRTLALMDAGEPVIRKAALWWAPEKLYGTADLIVKQSWLFQKYPHLKPRSGVYNPEKYVVLDLKFIASLNTPEKAADLLAAQSQVRLYSYMLARLQDHAPEHAYLICRDRHDAPLPVEVNQQLHAPLSRDLAVMRDAYLHLKLCGSQYLPWRDAIVAPNYRNDNNAPWCNAIKEIAHHHTPGRALEILPGINQEAAALLRADYKSVDGLFAHDPTTIPFEKLPGVGDKKAAILRAVVQANQEGKPTPVDAKHVPPPAEVTLYADFEFIVINPEIENDWPLLDNRARLFMIGVAADENGKWTYRQFTATEDTERGERDMLLRFLTYLQDKGVFDVDRAAIYHWTDAEKIQAAKMAERHKLPKLATLPWCDLKQPFCRTPIGVPGAFGFGLKEVAKALGEYAPEYKVEWPKELGVGLAAMAMGIEMYKSKTPMQTKEFKVLSAYLEADVFALRQVLRWLRASAAAHDTRGAQGRRRGWYVGGRTDAHGNRRTVAAGGWYQFALDQCRKPLR